jgi:DNA-binding response OmpR family regulator
VAKDKKGRKHQLWDGVNRRAATAVLVVNDDGDACELLVRILGSAGFRATGAHSQNEAMGQIGELLPRCVVLDMSAGGIGSSLKLLDTIRSHDDNRVSSSRAVLVAASTKNRSFSFQSGADAYLIRPFHADDLVAQVRDVVDRPDDDRARHRRDQLASNHD